MRKKIKAKKKYILLFIWSLVVLVAAAAVVMVFQVFEFDFLSNHSLCSDDQRSTIWPLLVSMSITQMGTLITTYVFLKGALDRTVDEKPYYSRAIKRCRKEIMQYLLWYAIAVLFITAFIILLYAIYYFDDKRMIWPIRLLLILMHIVCMFWFVCFLKKCIYIENSLLNTSKELLDKDESDAKQISDSIPDFEKIRELVGELALKGEERLSYHTINEFLRIDGEGAVDSIKFINQFSEREKLLLVLVEGRSPNDFQSEQSLDERIKTALQNGTKVFTQSDIEKEDAEANGWEKGAYDHILSFQGSMDCSVEKFCEIYTFLSKFRDTLQVQCEKDLAKGKAFFAMKEDSSIICLFFYYWIYMSVNIFRILPKVNVFAPAERYYFANFYNTRFEGASFRAALFCDTVFARSKLNNCNFGMANFRNCEFFSIDSRNCSISNALFDFGSLADAIFDNVDLTGTYLNNCNLERASFNNSILSNMEIGETKFHKNVFTDCKITNIKLCHITDNSLVSCDFRDSDISNIQFCVSKEMRQSPNLRDGIRDEIVKKYLQVLSRPDIEDSFWSESVRKRVDYSKIRNIAKAFSVPDSSFYGAEMEKGHPNRIKQLQIWEVILKSAVVEMRENVFQKTVMPEMGFFRVNLEQSIFKDAVMNKVQMLSVEMPGSIMSGANMREGVLWAVNMQSNAMDDVILYGSVCVLVNLSDASLRSMHASKAYIKYCLFNKSDCSHIDLTKAEIESSSFRDAILTGAEFTEAKFRKVSFENSISDRMLSSYTEFEKCSIRNAFLKRSSFNYTEFINCDFGMADFSDSTVGNVVFRRCNFLESNFRNTCFINARFEGNDDIKIESFENARFIGCSMKGAEKISRADLQKWNIRVAKKAMEV